MASKLEQGASHFATGKPRPSNNQTQCSYTHRTAIRYVEDPASVTAPAEERELPLIGILKLLRQMLPLRSRLVWDLARYLCLEVMGLCRATWEAAGKGAVSEGLPSPFSGYVVARQLALELAMEYVGEACASRRIGDMEMYNFNALWQDVPVVILEAEESEPSTSNDDYGGVCSLVRKPRSSDLLPYRLAFLAKLLRRVVETACETRGVLGWPLSSAWWDLLSLVKCPLRVRFMTAGRSHEKECGDEEEVSSGGVSSPLISALLDHDDLLFGTLTDLQCACVALLTNPPTLRPRMFPPDEVDIDEAQAALREFQWTTFPPVVFASLLQAVDEELFIDYLISNETSALEYVTRAVKFLVWHLGRRMRDGREGEGGEGEPNEAVAEAAAFLVGLGARLQGMVDRNLFPYDISPLLERVRELREALDG